MESQQLTSSKKRLLVQRPSNQFGGVGKIKSKSAGSGNYNHTIWQPTGTLSPLDMRRNVPDAVTCPGWNTKVTYNPMVMVGNWSEERLRKNYACMHLKENVPKVNPSDYDTARSEALQVRIQNETGVSKDYMFKQHDTLYDHNQITMYDENYNQRWREKNLPSMRRWNFSHLAWVPEKTDYPLFGPPTQFGLAENMRERWQKELNEKLNTYNTIYRSKYLTRSADSRPQQLYVHRFPKSSAFLRTLNPLHGRPLAGY